MELTKAEKYYEAALQRNRDAWAKKKQAKVDAGTYRGRGRPRKFLDPPYPPSQEAVEVAVNPI